MNNKNKCKTSLEEGVSSRDENFQSTDDFSKFTETSSRNNESETVDDYLRRDTVQRGKLIGLYTEGLEIDTLCVHFSLVLLRISCSNLVKILMRKSVDILVRSGQVSFRKS